MQELFGIPMGTIAWVMGGLFSIVVLIVLLVALRNRVFFKLGVRNIPRRRQETVLIVLGLMLATLIISAAFGTGDTITHTIRVTGIEALGEVDETVRLGEPSGARGGGAFFNFGSRGRPQYFPAATAAEVEQGLSSVTDVDVVVPAIVEEVPLIAPATRQSVPQAAVVAAAPDRLLKLRAPLGLDTNEVLSLAELAPGEVYLSESGAKELDAKAGDTLEAYFSPQPTQLKVRAIVEDGGASRRGPVVYLPLARAQEVLGKPEEVNRLLISNVGGPLEGAERSEAVKAAAEPLLEGKNLRLDLVKKDAIDEANLVGNAFVSIFVIFGLFSIAAGILLIFLIFVMLAAERKPEMGMARAVGAQRRHLVQMFLMEGMLYDLAAAGVGALLGVGVSFLLVRVMAIAFATQSDEFNIFFNIEPRSLLVAYTIGMVLTFIIVTISAWRVSVLNIVRAIRDLPEPRANRRSRKAAFFAVATVIIGILFTILGFQTTTLFPFMLGTSLFIIGSALVARRLHVPDRAVFTFAGVALLVWWLLPVDIYRTIMPFLPEFKQGLEMFFLSGIMIVAGAVWTTIYNADLLVAGLLRIVGPSRRLAPILKTAISYPLHNRFRTGMTLAMFSLVVFTIIFMSVIVGVNSLVLQDRERLTGGYDVLVSTSFTNPVNDLGEAIRANPELKASDYEATGATSAMPAKIAQVGATDPEPKDYLLRGADEAYLRTKPLSFTLRAEGYETDDAIWEALRTQPGVAVVDSFIVPSKNNFNIQVGGTQFRLEGVFLEDETMKPIELAITNPLTQSTSRVTVIGVIDELSFFTSGVYVSQTAMNEMFSMQVPPTAHFVRLQEGVDSEKAAKALEAAFIQNGVEARSTDSVLNEALRSQRTINYLLQGFMGLGLLVGIAALGVVSARAVVERRRQIGALRAIGFQKGMVQASFLLESSFVAMLGILIGTALGLALSYVVVGFIVEQLGVRGATFTVPWTTIGFIIVLSYIASLLTTFLPAWQASRVYPAEALRYE